MICPHCAFPNEDEPSICIKCKRPMAEPAKDPLPPIPGAKPALAGGVSAAPASRPPAEAARNSLAEVERLEREGDLRGVFVRCQSILIDHFEGLSPQQLAQVYLIMGRISIQQEKQERARKYLDQALARDPNLPGLAEMIRTLEAAEAGSATAALGATEPAPAPATGDLPSAGQTEQVSGSGRMAFAATFWSRSLALAVDGLLVVCLLAGMVALAAVILGFDGEAVVLVLAGGLTNLFVVCALLVFLLLTYLTIFARIGGQTLGKMLLGLRVVRLDGHSLTTWHAIRRALGMVLAGLPGLGGFLWAAFDLNRRGWHDRVGGTLVVKIHTPAGAAESTSQVAQSEGT